MGSLVEDDGGMVLGAEANLGEQRIGRMIGSMGTASCANVPSVSCLRARI